jgi:hypothetical protein
MMERERERVRIDDTALAKYMQINHALILSNSGIQQIKTWLVSNQSGQTNIRRGRHTLSM